MLINCKQCDNQFKPRSTGNVYCTKECTLASRWKPEIRSCANDLCSVKFTTSKSHKDQKYCSRSCSATVSNFARECKSNKKFCKFCNKSLYSLIGNVYCSNVCQQAGQNQDRLKIWLETGVGILGSSPTHYIRKYIFDSQQGLCRICSMPNMWNDMEIRFILDHIDGNSENNHRDNLRLICPNCDSQLPTYKSKNKGNGRHFRRERYANGQSY